MKQRITEEYRAQQAALHAAGNYGLAALQWGEVVNRLLVKLSVHSLLDYGCGSRRSLLKAITLREDVVYEGFDPAVPEYSAEPCPAELVVCIDVLEHIEPQLLHNVLDHLAELCDPFGLFSIHTGPAGKTLPDGRNAHLIQQDKAWWLARLQPRFEVLGGWPTTGGFAVVVRTRGVR